MKIVEFGALPLGKGCLTGGSRAVTASVLPTKGPENVKII
jgi:hypothetical protein